MPTETFRRRVNDELPSDIHILKVEFPHASFTRDTTPWREAISIKFHGAGRRSRIVRMVGPRGY